MVAMMCAGGLVRRAGPFTRPTVVKGQIVVDSHEEARKSGRRVKGGKGSNPCKVDEKDSNRMTSWNWLEITGGVATVLAVVGVVLNNRKLTWCFPLWIISNVLWAYLHVRVDLWSGLVRDVVFTGLAFEGWYQWTRKEKE